MKICPKCHKTSSNTYCPNCGVKLNRLINCRHCGDVILPTDHSCRGCGLRRLDALRPPVTSPNKTPVLW